MKKTLFLLFASVAILAGAQTKENNSPCPKDKADCPMMDKGQCPQGPQDKQCPQPGARKRGPRMDFMKNLSEADRATVKGVMDEYKKECKAIHEKCKAARPAKGEKPTEEQMDAMNKARLATRIEILKVQEKYYDKLRKTLTPWQASALIDMDNNQANRPNRQQFPKGQQHHRGNACR